MPTRYSGSRKLIQLGAKTEVALAAQWAYQQAGKGNEATRNLTWASFHLILARDGRPNFYHKTLAQLASQQNPTGETTCLDILKLPAPSKPEVQDSNVEVMQTLDPNASSTDEGSEVEKTQTSIASASAPVAREFTQALLEVEAVAGLAGLLAHPVRRIVHARSEIDSLQVACGCDASGWVEPIEVTAEEAVRQYWTLCARPRCFKRVRSSRLQDYLGSR